MKQRLVLLTVLKSRPNGLLDGSFSHLILPGSFAEMREHFRAALVMDSATTQGRPGISSYVVAVAGVRPPTRSFLEKCARLVADGRLEPLDSFSLQAPADLAPYIGRVDALSRDLHYSRQASQSEPPPTAEVIPIRRP